MLERIIACFGRYAGTGMMTGLFLISLIFLFFKEKNKTNRLIFIYVPVATLLIYFCPLWAWVVYRMIGEDLYWRFLWLLPVVPVVAYAAVKMVQLLDRKIQPFAGTVAALIVILSGSLIYRSSHVTWAENLYHIPQEVIAVCDLIEPEEGKVKAAFPYEMFQYVRQYSAKIEMPYGREYILFDWADRSDLFYALSEDVLNPEKVASLARTEGCTYLVFAADKPIDGRLEDYGFVKYATEGDYCIYRDTTTDDQ